MKKQNEQTKLLAEMVKFMLSEELMTISFSNGDTSTLELGDAEMQIIKSLLDTKRFDIKTRSKQEIDGIENAQLKTSASLSNLATKASQVIKDGGPVQSDWSESRLSEWWSYYSDTIATWTPASGRPAPGRGEAQLDMAFKLAKRIRGNADFVPLTGQKYGIKYRDSETSSLLTTEDKAPSFAALRNFVSNFVTNFVNKRDANASLGLTSLKQLGIQDLKKAMETSLSVSEKQFYNSTMYDVLKQIQTDGGQGKLIVLTANQEPFIVNDPFQIGIVRLRSAENRPDFVIRREGSDFKQWIFPQTLS